MDAHARYVIERIQTAGGLFGSACFIGGLGYYILGGGQWMLGECMYMAVVTLSTVGFAETLEGIEDVPYARLWTVVLIVLGSGTLLYFASTITAILVQGDIRGLFQRRRMRRELGRASGHVICCGAGVTGRHVVRDLVESDQTVVVIDQDESKIVRLQHELGPLLHIVGDATEDEVLEEAGIDRAVALIAGLRDDRDNLFVAITARALNTKLRIVCKMVDPDNESKMRRAGADAVVSPALIGGVRLASEVSRPIMVRFIDELFQGEEGMAIKEFSISKGSSLAGQTLGEVSFRSKTGALVLALRPEHQSTIYNPGAEVRVDVGDTIVVLVAVDQIQSILALVRTP